MKFEPTKLPMTNEEIRREYLEAKDRKAQIRILADENLCSPECIRRVLAIEGVMGVPPCDPVCEERYAVAFTEDEYYTVNAIALHMLDLNAKKIDRLEADLKRINEHLSEQRAVGDILRGIIEKVGGVPTDYARLFKEGE